MLLQVLDLVHPSLFPLVYGLSRRTAHAHGSSNRSPHAQQQQQQQAASEASGAPSAAPEVPGLHPPSSDLERLSIATGIAHFQSVGVSGRRRACPHRPCALLCNS